MIILWNAILLFLHFEIQEKLKVYFDYSDYHVPCPVITTGVFDGVHKGHVELFNRLNEVAASVNGESVVVTFWPHPQMVLNPGTSPKLLNTLDEKLSLLEKSNIQHVVIVPFTSEFSKLSSEDFIIHVLVQQLKVKRLVVGYNHHFGKDRKGNYELMKQYGEQYGFGVEKLEAKLVENEKVSATLVRNALLEGNVEMANTYLGYTYMISGSVVEGDRIGRTIGFPTANIKIDQNFKLIPKEGVYAVEVELSGVRYPGMLNIGYRPTIKVQSMQLTIEVHIINFKKDIYNQNLTLYFKQRIRNEMKFDSLEHLKHQLTQDKLKVTQIFGVPS